MPGCLPCCIGAVPPEARAKFKTLLTALQVNLSLNPKHLHRACGVRPRAAKRATTAGGASFCLTAHPPLPPASAAVREQIFHCLLHLYAHEVRALRAPLRLPCRAPPATWRPHF